MVNFRHGCNLSEEKVDRVYKRCLLSMKLHQAEAAEICMQR